MTTARRDRLSPPPSVESTMRFIPLFVAVVTLSPVVAGAQSPVIERGWEEDVPALPTLVEFDREQSDLRVAVERFAEDRAALGRRYDVDYSPVPRERMERFF